ncbi:MAG: proline dehydrogenase family protein [Armatimonadetes bacterium]|nr:proline dehydrogenase family protein [Armatimonadota bacterium]
MSFYDNLIAGLLPFVPKPLIKLFSERYIAGEKLEDAIDIIRCFRDQKISATIDILGEHAEDEEEVKNTIEDYKAVLTKIYGKNLDSNISVKLTQLGLRTDKYSCRENAKILLEEAQKYNNFVRIDMEDSICVEDTLDIFYDLQGIYSNLGIVIQAYLRRSLEDIKGLMKIQANIRLCKGIYNEKRDIAYKDKEIINKNYAYLLELLLRNGNYVGIATHDEKLVWEALNLVERLSLDKSKFEFQMLLGVDQGLREIIINSGCKLRVYVPFGRNWHAYCLRRLRENPQLAGYIFKDLFTP